VKNFLTSGTDWKACYALTAQINGAAEARIDTADDGFDLASRPAYFGVTAANLKLAEYEWRHASLWTEYDHTGGNFTLTALRLRAAAEGSDYVIQNATLGFIAFYRTNA
jgi:hypothetical protein